MTLSVLHILPSLALGGAERFTIELAALQRLKGLDVHILSMNSENDFLVEAVNARKIPLHFAGQETSRLSRYRKIFSLANKFDVLHMHSPRGLRFLSPLIPLLRRKRIIYTRHGLDPLSGLKFKLTHLITRPFIDYVTFVTDFSYEIFVQNHNWNSNRLKVITNGILVPEQKQKKRSDKTRFGSVGRMVALKGQRFLLEATTQLIEELEEDYPGFCVNFFGLGPVEDELRLQASTIPSGVVTFHGEVANIENIYDEIDVLVVASESEGLSMVIIEAMARGIPTIATDVGGNATLVLDNKNGIIIPYGDSGQLAKAMKKMLAPELVTQFGSAARAHIMANFSLENSYESYLECYQ